VSTTTTVSRNALVGEVFFGSVNESCRLTSERRHGQALETVSGAVAHGRSKRTDFEDCQRRFGG
jgi:hypothetical protein